MAEDLSTPQLHALLVFKMAARHGSFTRAAAALGISQPAVSRTVCWFEDTLGMPLFDRLHRGVRLNEAGRYLYEQISLGLTLIDQAMGEVRKFSESDQVTLAVSTATATWWLMPRVARFKQANPQIEIRCITTDTDPDLDADGIDLAITLGRGEWSRYTRWRIFDEEVFPVCSPEYARELGENPTPQSLCSATLLHLEQRYRSRIDWADWLAKFGVSLPRSTRQFRFTDYSIVLHAALEGQGVALGWRHLVGSLLQQGRLVRPLKEHVVTDYPIYIIASRTRHMRPSAVALRDWLLEESSSDRSG
ncbi:LysR family transcriptional regulator [Aromatoleum toluvorans]|uniref:LysR family transcriptional regulator n=1 Tax=Aromatoleum toluvorans TaxID=92002 RepID=A0ABX1Q6X1_9RHOO|nr:LysR substrate-binding domain-containing protein [Aromatoleum toluvorans]NMG46116.1 LysR family transcriptional regulator [Aromatoleum toluvorans]